MTIDLRAILLIIAVVLFLLAGFNLVHNQEHFLLVPLGLASFAASFLPFSTRSTP